MVTLRWALGWPAPRPLSARDAAVGCFLLCVLGWTLRARRKKKRRAFRDVKELTEEGGRMRDACKDGYAGLIGNTPMIHLPRLSALATQLVRRQILASTTAATCTSEVRVCILVKMESLNPGGTGKDRIAKGMIEEAERSGALQHPQGVVVEGTSGSTGIALAALCRAKGYRCVIAMPDDQAQEKQRLLQQFGAEVHVVRPSSIVHDRHYCKEAQRIANETEGAVFMNQFENLANYRVHYCTTGPEIWRQVLTFQRSRDTHTDSPPRAQDSPRTALGNAATSEPSGPDAFVMAAGTGGTIAGVTHFLRTKRPDLYSALVDPPGSSLFYAVKHGVCYAPEQAEQRLRRHRYDSIVEGIGLDRITANFKGALPDISDAFRITDQQALEMAHFLLHEEGLFVGSSSAMNCVGALYASLALNRSSTVVTVICDSGQRHLTRFWNRDYCVPEYGLKWPETPPRGCSSWFDAMLLAVPEWYTQAGD